MSLLTILFFSILFLVQSSDSRASKKSYCSATFRLEVKKSDAMKLGSEQINCVNAIAVPMHREGRGQFTGVDIFFAPRTKNGNLPNSTEEIQHGDYANLNLMTDAAGRVTQVNLTVVRPGKTVARTIAWKPEDLKKYFSDVAITSDRVVLKSSGTYDDAQAESEQASLQWEVNVNVQITDKARR